MSSTSAATNAHSVKHGRWRGCAYERGDWSAINIATMVVGFVLFWPIGLFILFWCISGRDVRQLPRWVHRQWSRVSSSWFRDPGLRTAAERSDNVVFDEFQQTQYDRIREIRDEIEERDRRFADFREQAKRSADEDEFRRFMAERPGGAET